MGKVRQRPDHGFACVASVGSSRGTGMNLNWRGSYDHSLMTFLPVLAMPLRPSYAAELWQTLPISSGYADAKRNSTLF